MDLEVAKAYNSVLCLRLKAAMVDTPPILSIYLYSYSITLCSTLLVSHVFSYRHQNVDCTWQFQKKRSRIRFNIIWYLQIILSAAVVIELDGRS